MSRPIPGDGLPYDYAREKYEASAHALALPWWEERYGEDAPSPAEAEADS